MVVDLSKRSILYCDKTTKYQIEKILEKLKDVYFYKKMW